MKEPEDGKYDRQIFKNVERIPKTGVSSSLLENFPSFTEKNIGLNLCYNSTCWTSPPFFKHLKHLRDFSFSRRQVRRWLSSELLRRVVW
jgi:hypothetical protein